MVNYTNKVYREDPWSDKIMNMQGFIIIRDENAILSGINDLAPRFLWDVTTHMLENEESKPEKVLICRKKFWSIVWGGLRPKAAVFMTYFAFPFISLTKRGYSAPVSGYYSAPVLSRWVSYYWKSRCHSAKGTQKNTWKRKEDHTGFPSATI